MSLVCNRVIGDGSERDGFNLNVSPPEPSPITVPDYPITTIQIGNSILMMGDEMPGAENCAKSAETAGSSPISMYVYVPDADAAFKQAVAAGAAVNMPVADMFWGDRAGSLKDPFGYSWMVATHKQDLTNDEIQKGAEAFFAQMAAKRT